VEFWPGFEIVVKRLITARSTQLF